jgi:hypothetical protein
MNRPPPGRADARWAILSSLLLAAALLGLATLRPNSVRRDATPSGTLRMTPAPAAITTPMAEASPLPTAEAVVAERTPSWADELSASWGVQPDAFFLERCVKTWTWEQLLLALRTPPDAFRADGLARALKAIVFRTMVSLDAPRAFEVALEVAGQDPDAALAYVGPALVALAAYHRETIPGWLDRLPSDALEAGALQYLVREGTPELLPEMASRAAALDARQPGVEPALAAIQAHWADIDPAALGAWLLSARPDAARREVELQRLIERWGPSAPDALGQWIAGLPPERRSKLAGMARSWAERWVRTGQAAGSQAEAQAAQPLLQHLGTVISRSP